jgi:hypothetical protein
MPRRASAKWGQDGGWDENAVYKKPRKTALNEEKMADKESGRPSLSVIIFIINR